MLGEQQFDGVPQHRVDTDWSTCRTNRGVMITADETAVIIISCADELVAKQLKHCLTYSAICLLDTLDICAGAVVLALDTFCRSRDLQQQLVTGQWPPKDIAAASSKFAL